MQVIRGGVYTCDIGRGQLIELAFCVLIQRRITSPMLVKAHNVFGGMIYKYRLIEPSYCHPDAGQGCGI